MKLRFEPNIIKFRLSVNELSDLEKGEAISEKLLFPKNDMIQYKVTPSESQEELNIQFASHEIIASIPSKTIIEWRKSGEDGVSKEFQFKNGHRLTLIIEKDLHRRKKNSTNISTY